MNKYLEKVAFGSLKKMTSNYLQTENGRDLAHTGVIGTLGGVTSYATSKILNSGGKHGKAAILGTGLGLVGDFVATKINHKLDSAIDSPASSKITKQASHKVNKYLEIITSKDCK